MKKLRKHQNAILLGFIITILLSWLVNPEAKLLKENLDKIEGIIYDFRLKATLPNKPRASDHNIFIIDVDEKSLKEQGRWPWSRIKIADMVTKLKDAGVIVVGFDVVFSEPELNPVDALVEAQQLNHLSAEELAALHQKMDADQYFAEVLSDYEVVLGGFLHTGVDIGQLKSSPITLADPNAVLVKAVNFPNQVSNIEILQDAAIGQGLFNSVVDVDGSIRRAALVFKHNGLLYPSLALEISRIYELAETIDIETAPVPNDLRWHHIERVSFGPARQKSTDDVGRVLVPFKGPKFSFPYYSATDILNDRIPQELLDGGVALVGTSAVGIADLRETAIDIQYPGVEVHANLLEALLSEEDLFHYRHPDWEAIIIIQLMFFGILLSILLPMMGPSSMAVWGSLSLVLVIYFNFYMWIDNQIDLPLTQPMLLVISITIFNISRGFFSENANRQQIKSMFDQYVPPAHIDQMLTDPSSASLKGDRKEMSVLFSDIRSFTSISETLSANELKDMLNEYFSPITKSIFDHNGTIDKYVGDMVMAFWGAPIDNPNHAEQAVMGGFDMLEITARLRDEFVKKDWPAVRIGIGINTGDMNVGDMGSEYRRAYTVLGDAVNLGSRLEGLTKAYGLEYLVSEFTRAQCPNIAFRPVDKVKVKGKDEAVAIFEPVCPIDQLDETTEQEIKDLESAYEDYLAQNWDAAEGKYQVLLQKFPNRYLYELFLERIDHNRDADLGEDWDGSFTHTSK